ncbi:hypothetical protein T07_12738 [Trichinella nelsoni]|uniref:Uncharacterized protein n=1 Tax=Trichinella nelsoni TaxID=6336 RepID=A0A0V0S106_9BILA|nr:hypothetical protein T07_12738 [Trichinella nelsoni]
MQSQSSLTEPPSQDRPTPSLGFLHLKIIHYAILRIKCSGNVKELARDYKLRKETKEECWKISCQLQAVDGQTDSMSSGPVKEENERLE